MIKYYNNPPQQEWVKLIKRPASDTVNLDDSVSRIMDQVRREGDKALREFARSFDHVEIDQFKVSTEEFLEASKSVSEELKAAIAVACKNIQTFHTSQQTKEQRIETMPGVTCWRRSVPIERVGLYIPGGSAPLFSTILMLAIPAQIAGCKRIVLLTPCDSEGNIAPVTLYTAYSLGIEEVYKVGGAQAIAAMAYGTESIPKVDKIFGPGNQYVMKAKELVQKSGIAIDLPAGPSEVLVLADQSAYADFVAADMLAQAEHGTDSQVILVTTDSSLVDKVNKELQRQLKYLPRADLARKTLSNSFAVSFATLDACVDFSNAYAPEHLIMAVANAESHVDRVVNAGSVFLGNYSCESAGDYASGTNHTLPTHGYAKSYSGVSLDSFVKKITFQQLTQDGLKNIGQTIEVMAEAEQLIAHKNAVSIRLKRIDYEE